MLHEFVAQDCKGDVMHSIERMAVLANLTMLGIVRDHLDALETKVREQIDDDVDDPQYVATELQQTMQGLKAGLKHFERLPR